MMTMLPTIAIIVLCLLAEGFFSGSEIGVVSADRAKLRMDAAKGSRGAKLALEMLSKPEWLLSTTLVGTNIAVVTNTTLVAALVIELLGPQYSWLAVALVAPLIWIFGEIVPKSVFQQRANELTPRVIFILKFFSYIFYPILMVFSVLAKIISKVFGVKKSSSPFTLREEIFTMMQMPTEQGDIHPIEQKMIRRLFNFGETTAGDIMVPLIDVVCIEKGENIRAALRLAKEKSHHLIPVYSKRVDYISGVVDCLELMGKDHDLPIQDFITSVIYVPETKSIQDLLVQMRKEGQSIVIVVDEYGGAAGIVTVEDIIEEVVEDIQDEYDVDEIGKQWIRRLDDREYLVSARIELDILTEQLRIDLPKDEFSSLAGFLLEKAKDIPAVGERIAFQEIEFTIERATPRMIQEVRIRW